MNIPNIRLISQQLTNPQFSDVHELVAWMGMLQAQDYKMMRWAIGIRLKNPTMEKFRKAYSTGAVIRTHLFRCTWQLIAAEDVNWMLKLCSEKNKRAINGYTAYRGHTISEKEYGHTNELIYRTLSGHKSMKKDELSARLVGLGLPDDNHTLSIYLRRAEQDGIICSGNFDERQNTYALMGERVPMPNRLSKEESLAILARKYLRSHSPATLEDFAWWTNLSMKECREAIESIRKEIFEENYDNSTYYIHQDCNTSRKCRNLILLLPAYDEYLLGYKSRNHIIEHAFRHKAYSNNGLFYPLIARNGTIVGRWHPKKAAEFFKEEYAADIFRLLRQYNDFINS